MSKLRLLMPALFATLALSAVAAGSAQAGWLVSGSLLVGSTALASKTIVDERDHPIKAIGPNATDPILIECPALTLTGGKISEPDKFLVSSLEFKECTAVEPTGCALGNPTVGSLPIEGLWTLDGLLGAKTKVKAENANGLLFTFKLEGTSCAESGKLSVTGQFVLLAPEGKDERQWHLLTFLTETEGELELGSTPATIFGSVLAKLETEKPWSFD